MRERERKRLKESRRSVHSFARIPRQDLEKTLEMADSTFKRVKHELMPKIRMKKEK